MPTFTEVVVGLSGKSAARKFNDQEKPYYERVEYAIGYALPQARNMPVEPPKPPVDPNPPVDPSEPVDPNAPTDPNQPTEPVEPNQP